MRFSLIFALVLLAGCGAGPKRLSRSDYRHGKAAFELLERLEASYSPSFQQAADAQIEAVGTHNLDVTKALIDYNTAIIMRIGAQENLESVENEAIIHPPTDAQKLKAFFKDENLAKTQLADTEPLIKLCHDDAEAYFEANAPATGTCRTSLDLFRAKYPVSQ